MNDRVNDRSSAPVGSTLAVRLVNIETPLTLANVTRNLYWQSIRTVLLNLFTYVSTTEYQTELGLAKHQS